MSDETLSDERESYNRLLGLPAYAYRSQEDYHADLKIIWDALDETRAVLDAARDYQRQDHEAMVQLADHYMQERDTLAEALDKWTLTAEHYGPPPPDHICGSPDASCDTGCMEFSYFVHDLVETRKLLASIRERTEEKS